MSTTAAMDSIQSENPPSDPSPVAVLGNSNQAILGSHGRVEAGGDAENPPLAPYPSQIIWNSDQVTLGSHSSGDGSGNLENPPGAPSPSQIIGNSDQTTLGSHSSDVENPPLAPPPSQIIGNYDQANLGSHSNDEAIGDMGNPPLVTSPSQIIGNSQSQIIGNSDQASLGSHSSDEASGDEENPPLTTSPSQIIANYDQASLGSHSNDEAIGDMENPLLVPSPSQIIGNSDQAALGSHSVDEARGNMENLPLYPSPWQITDNSDQATLGSHGSDVNMENQPLAPYPWQIIGNSDQTILGSHGSDVNMENPLLAPYPWQIIGNSDQTILGSHSSDFNMVYSPLAPSPSQIIGNSDQTTLGSHSSDGNTENPQLASSLLQIIGNSDQSTLGPCSSDVDMENPPLDLPPLQIIGNSDQSTLGPHSSHVLIENPQLALSPSQIGNSDQSTLGSHSSAGNVENSLVAPSQSQIIGNSDQATLGPHSRDGNMENPPLAQSPLQIIQNSDQSTLSPHSSDEASGNMVNSLKPNGFSRNKSSKRKINMLRSSGDYSFRRSSRLVENAGGEKSPPSKRHKSGKKVCFFVGEPVPEDEARRIWPWRYEKTKGLQNNGKSSKHEVEDDEDDDKLVSNIKCHYSKAEILKTVFDLGDCAYVKGPKGGSNYVGRILEFFETIDGEDYFSVQWFFRTQDTVIMDDGRSHDKKRLFYSTLVNDNLLDCIISKVEVVQITPDVNLKTASIPPCDFYFDMKYSVDYSTFSTIDTDEMSSSKPELALLDMYSGCGGMSTGLCFGTKVCGIDLVTRWAVDMNKAACESLKLNHPETQIRNEPAEDFLNLLKEWDKMCRQYGSHGKKELRSRIIGEADGGRQSKLDCKNSCEYEVGKILDICYGDPTESGKRGVNFKVRWVGYGPSDDTWEPIEGLRKCHERIREFVLKGMKDKILPRPGDVAVICGGPPCQGISGYNRFRNVDSPLDDERNRQIVIFMDIVDFLKPKFVLMENVIDILRFANGCLGRYAISRLVRIHYQARLGIMAAGCYGLPQFRLRVFLWGAHPHEVLPQFPLPTHDVVIKYGFPSDFERNVVAYDEGQHRDLEKIIVLSDAIADLPPVENDEKRDEISYTKQPETEFQKYIRAAKYDMTGSRAGGKSIRTNCVLYDHLPYPLNEDDCMRVSNIPKRKGANFRDLPGLVIGFDNVVRRAKEQNLMPSGKHWAPDYAINFRDGRSSKPFGRLWWDETVPTVFCFPDPHMRAVLHPEQDRLLTLRECARLQGFHDHYKFCGKLKERYSQVGNAVAVSVGRSLGYSLGMAVKKLSGHEHLMTLPPKFSHSTTVQLQSLLEKIEE